jgi:hypothetical protein
MPNFDQPRVNPNETPEQVAARLSKGLELAPLEGEATQTATEIPAVIAEAASAQKAEDMAKAGALLAQIKGSEVSQGGDVKDFDKAVAGVETYEVWKDRFEQFGKSLVNDPDMAALLSKFRETKEIEAAATSGDFVDLNQVKLEDEAGYESSLDGDKSRPVVKMKLFSGGDKIVDAGQAAIKQRREIGDQIVALMCQKFEAAGLNKDKTRAIVTPETSNLRRAEEIMGVPLLVR